MEPDSLPKNKDLTEESSKRAGAPATDLARQLESDDAKGAIGTGTVSSPDGDGAAENRVATSLDNQ